MNNVISMLEKIGSDASLSKSSAPQLGNTAVEQLLDLNLINSLQRSDIDAAERFLGTRSLLVCGIHPAEEPGNVPPVEQPDEDDGEQKESNRLLRSA
ncbi:hypothetical protein [Rheinheimera maricola]|uniref:Uncharacterized protein n=1 Tax=Rheinheimera maricola TaxID=2793282 RepID=A0ABS7X5A8_9GAMM|nr:hypothetical protein [Rheinheimera maricola]MBZ9610728.1 hypothetical protein [Rheinheimera maricola]